MMEVSFKETWYDRIVRILPEFIPRPDCGRWWQNLLFILLIVALQSAIIPSIFGPNLIVDLVIPWLVVSFVRQKSMASLVVGAVAAFALELHSSVPRGFYFCSFWIMHSIIIEVRPTLSWRHRVPWIVTIAACELWVALFELFLLVFLSGFEVITFGFIFFLLLRVIIAVGIGMVLRFCRVKMDNQEMLPE